MKYNFDNQVALVTGGAYGIGRAAFAEKKVRVVVADIIEDKEVIDFINSRGG